jgi:superfamily II DNA or RNA helicase
MASLTLALPALLHQYPLRIREEALRLVEDDAVRSLEVTDEETLAEVQMDECGVNVRWAHEGGVWQGETDLVSGKKQHLACCAVLIAVLRKLRRNETLESLIQMSPAEEVEIWQEKLEAKLGRRLVSEEVMYLNKILKRYERFVEVKAIYDHDVVRLQPKWRIENVDPLVLWPEAPSGVVEFWYYISLALHEKKLVLPLFLRDPEEMLKIMERLGAWREKNQVRQWKRRIEVMMDEDLRRGITQRRSLSECVVARQYALKLMISSTYVKLVKWVGDKAEVLSVDELEQLENSYQKQLLSFESKSEKLWLQWKSRGEGVWVSSFQLVDQGDEVWLARILETDDLKGLLLNRAGEELKFAEDVLKWVGEWKFQEDKVLHLRLVDRSGERPVYPMLIVRSLEKTYYINEEWIYEGPEWLVDEHYLARDIDIPLKSLHHEAGIRFLKKIGIELDELKKKIIERPWRLVLKAECEPLLSKNAVPLVKFIVEAQDDEGVGEYLTEGGWEPKLRLENEDEVMWRGRERMLELEEAMLEFNSRYDSVQQCFRLRMTKQFPESFLEWTERYAGLFELEADYQIKSIVADPVIARLHIEAKQSDEIDWFDIKTALKVDDPTISAAELRKLVAARGGFVQLADRSWRRVKIELTVEQRQLMQELGIGMDEIDGGNEHRVFWRQVREQALQQIVPAEAWQKLQKRLETIQLMEPPVVPSELKLTLRPYQVLGFEYLVYLARNQLGGVLADDMGLGKTLQSIAYICWLRKQYRNPWPVLIVCPKSVVDVWLMEFEKAASHIKAGTLADGQVATMMEALERLDVVVINYAQLRMLQEGIGQRRWLLAILDEAQHIKNPDSLVARAAFQLKAEHRLILTGTPIENRLLDLWSLMCFAMPGVLGDKKYFSKHFDKRRDEAASLRLAARLKPFLLRRTKKEVAQDLPDKTEETLFCELTEMQRNIYQTELAKAQTVLLNAVSLGTFNRNRFAVLQSITRLRQICCHPGLYLAGREEEESAKMTALLELLEPLLAEGQKVLLFSQYVGMLEIIKKELIQRDIRYQWLTGKTQNRAQVVNSFQDDPEPSVFLISLKAGGSGLNLTSASYVILYDPWWNPAVEAQAIDRAHRIGQRNPVTAYRLIAKNTIEEKILILQQKKREMLANVLDHGDFSSRLDESDFAFLFDLEQGEKMRSEEKTLNIDE